MEILNIISNILTTVFPPIAVLGGCGVFLFGWRILHNGKTWGSFGDGKSFLALIFLLMFLFRLCNPAFLGSSRYVCGLAVLAVPWGVYFLREFCKHRISGRVKPIAITAFVIVGICLAGTLKTMRTSKRTRMETEVFNFVRHKMGYKRGVVYLPDVRFLRAFAGNDISVIPQFLPMDGICWQNELESGSYIFGEQFILVPKNSDGEWIIARLDKKCWNKFYRGKNFTVLMRKNPRSPGLPPIKKREPGIVLLEDFSALREILVTKSPLKELKERGVGFAKSGVPLLLPATWQPNSGHGYNWGSIGDIDLKVIAVDGIRGNTLFYNGWAAGSVMSSLNIAADRKYELNFLYRGDEFADIAVCAYLFSDSGFMRTEVLENLRCGDWRQLRSCRLPIDLKKSGAVKFYLAFYFSSGKIMVDDISLCDRL